MISKIKRYLKTNKRLAQEIENMTHENMEMFKKLKELNEEKDMIKKLCRNQEQEIVDVRDTAFRDRQQKEQAVDELKLYKQGLDNHPTDIRAISVVRYGLDEDGRFLFAPVVFTMDQSGTTIKSRTKDAETHLNYALDSAKIKFMELFDPETMEMLKQ